MSDQAFKRGDYVRKRSGAFWEGDVVGDYSTDQTVDGVAVRLLGWKDGPVQIYPSSALELVDPANGRLRSELSTAYRRGREDMREEAAKVARTYAIPEYETAKLSDAYEVRDGVFDAIRKLEA